MVNWMHLDFTEEQEMFRNTVRAFVTKKIDPLEEESKKDYWKVREKVIRELGSMGIIGLSLPPELGGQGGDSVSLGIAAEEIGRSKVIGVSVVGLTGTIMNFAFGANRDLREEWLPRLLRGEATLGIGSTEPSTGSDVASIRATAVRKGEVYVLNGEKGPVSHVYHTDASLILTRTGAADSGLKGLTYFFVESNRPGIELYHFDCMENVWDLGGLRLRDVEVPAKHMVGEENRGFYLTMEAFDLERVLIPMSHIGAAEQSLEDTIEFAKQRKVFGRPIGAYEGIMFQIAEAATRLEACRAFMYQALRNSDRGIKFTKEAAMIRWYASKVALEALDVAIQVHGAIGYTDSVPHQRRYRYVRAGLISHGTQEIQKLIIGRELLGREIYDAALGRGKPP